MLSYLRPAISLLAVFTALTGLAYPLAMTAIAGGVAGLAAAAGVVSLASGVLGVPLSLEWSTIVGSVAAAGLSGVLAGWYPARRAAGLDVINALRQE